MSTRPTTRPVAPFSVSQLLVLVLAVVVLILVFAFARILFAPVLAAGVAAFVAGRLSPRPALVVGVAAVVGVVVFVAELALLTPVSRIVTAG